MSWHDILIWACVIALIPLTALAALATLRLLYLIGKQIGLVD